MGGNSAGKEYWSWALSEWLFRDRLAVAAAPFVFAAAAALLAARQDVRQTCRKAQVMILPRQISNLCGRPTSFSSALSVNSGDAPYRAKPSGRICAQLQIV